MSNQLDFNTGTFGKTPRRSFAANVGLKRTETKSVALTRPWLGAAHEDGSGSSVWGNV
jgi:hypothetical protein